MNSTSLPILRLQVVEVVVFLQTIEVYIVGALISLIEFALSQTGMISGLPAKLSCLLADVLNSYAALLKFIIAVFFDLKFFLYDAEVAALGY